VPVPGPSIGAQHLSRREFELARLRAELHGIPTTHRPLVLGLLVGVAGGLVGHVAFERWLGDRPAAFNSLGEPALWVGLGVATCWLVALLFGRSHGDGRIAQRLSAIRLCLCGYDIDGLGTEPDGCVVCPECGAAWRLPGEAGKT
jgi:hypothetical protein